MLDVNTVLLLIIGLVECIDIVLLLLIGSYADCLSLIPTAGDSITHLILVLHKIVINLVWLLLHFLVQRLNAVNHTVLLLQKTQYSLSNNNYTSTTPAITNFSMSNLS